MVHSMVEWLLIDVDINPLQLDGATALFACAAQYGMGDDEVIVFPGPSNHHMNTI